jgi:predicted Zn-dependent protease
MKTMMYFVIFGLIILIIGCAVNPITGKREFMIFSDQQEISFGEEADPDIRWQFGGDYNDQKLQEYVNSVGQKVAKVSDRNNIPYYFKVVDSSDINAFALPGGYIYITRGLLSKMDNEAQLAAVLGHEIGHVTARHSMKRMQNVLGFNMVLAILDQAASGSKSYQEYRGLVKTGSSVAFAAVSLGYGRDNELEADALGTKYADKAGYNPQGMVQLLVLLKSLSEREPSSVEEFFMSHPRTSIRIEAVNKLIAGAPADKGTFNQSEYKSNMNDLLVAQKAYEHYDKGEALRKKGSYDQAIAEYNEALKIRKLSKPYRGIALVNLTQGKYNQAVNEFKSALRIDPNDVFSHNYMGVAYMKSGNIDDASASFRKAISLYENYDDAYANLGEALYRQKKYADAQKALEMAVSLNPKHPKAYTTLGLVYEANNELQKAIEAYEQAVKVAPDDSYTNTARQRLTELKKAK